MRRAPVFLVLLLVTLPAVGGEPTRIEVAPDAVPVGTEWYGIYMGGKKCGNCKQVLSREADRFVSQMDMSMKLTAMGRRMEMTFLERKEFEAAPPYRFVSGISKESQDRQEQSVTVTQTLELLTAVVRVGESERTIEREPVDLSLLDEVTATFWVRGKPEPGASVTVRSFDLGDLEENLQTFTLDRVEPTAVSGMKTVYYEGRLSSLKHGEMGTMRLSETGRLLSVMMGGGSIEFRAEPEELAKDFDFSADLFVMALVKIDKPIGQATLVESLVVEVTGSAAGTLEDGPRQRVERKDGKTILRAGPTDPVKATPEEIAEESKATVEYPAEAPRVVALVKQAVGDAKTPREKVARLVAFVSEYVVDALDANSLTVDGVIDAKAGDCTEHSLLFACLARAAGIPARQVSGVMYMGDEVKAFGSHAWNEVVLDGAWVPVDATWNETVTDAGRIRLGHGARGAIAVATTMGNLEVRLIEVTRKEAAEKE